MKKCLILFLFTGGVILHAQFRLGVKAGMNLSQITYKGGSDLAELLHSNRQHASGFQIGPMMEFTIPIVKLGVEVAALYSQQGFQMKSFDHSNEKINNQVSTLEVPVSLKYPLNLLRVIGAYVALGPYASFKLSDNLKAQYYDQSFGAGLNFGLGVEWLKHIQLGANYMFGLTDSYACLSAGRNLKGQQRMWTISAAYLF